MILQCTRYRCTPSSKNQCPSCSSGATAEALEKLKKLMGLPSRDLVLECLIADALQDLEEGNAARKKK
jgi:hypothetical protein